MKTDINQSINFPVYAAILPAWDAACIAPCETAWETPCVTCAAPIMPAWAPTDPAAAATPAAATEATLPTTTAPTMAAMTGTYTSDAVLFLYKLTPPSLNAIETTVPSGLT